MVIAAIIVGLGSVGAWFFLKNDPPADSSAVQNTDIQSGDISAGPVSANPINSENTLPGSSLPPKTAAQPQQTGVNQTEAKKQAADLINKTNASAGEFDTMNNSAGQLDQNTSL